MKNWNHRIVFSIWIIMVFIGNTYCQVEGKKYIGTANGVDAIYFFDGDSVKIVAHTNYGAQPWLCEISNFSINGDTLRIDMKGLFIIRRNGLKIKQKSEKGKNEDQFRPYNAENAFHLYLMNKFKSIDKEMKCFRE